jgi:hypothetical protein
MAAPAAFVISMVSFSSASIMNFFLLFLPHKKFKVCRKRLNGPR